MDGKNEEDGRSTSGETQPEQVSGEGDNEQKTLLEEEIKKIIGDLDIKFEDSTPEEEEPSLAVTPFVSSYHTQTTTGSSSIGTPHRRTYKVETASTMSAATTVVHQRVPPKISVSHVKHEQFGISPISQGNQTQYTGIGNDSNMYCVGNDFDQPERDEITEPSCETVLTTTENTSSSCDPTTSTQQPLARRQRSVHRGSLAPLPEEPIKDFPDSCAAATPQPLYDRLMHSTNYRPPPQLPEYTSYNHRPVAEPVRYAYSSNIFPTDSGYVNQHQTQCYPDQQPHVCRITSNPPTMIDENVNRYNSAHMTCCTAKEKPEKPKRSSVSDYLLQKSRSFFGRSRPDSSDSGETVPQLYKACIKKGTTPQRFTFKAVTGGQMPYEICCEPPPLPQQICEVVAPCHCDAAYPQSTTCVLENEQRHGAPCNHPTTVSVPPVYSNPCYCSSKEMPRKSYEVCPEKGFEVFNKRSKHDSMRHGGTYNRDALSKAYYPEQGCEGYVSRKSNVPEKVEIYCFDHLNTGFFQTSDHPPPLFADIAIQQTERYATVFWAEVFGMVNVVFAFLIAMVLQTFKFVLQGIVRPIMMGFVQLLSDYLIKPFLTLLYNGFTQPISVFLYNVIASIRDVLQPLAKGLGYFVELVAVVLRAIRLVEVRNVTNITPCNPSAPHTR